MDAFILVGLILICIMFTLGPGSPGKPDGDPDYFK
jgi:hypothetical protein